MPVLFESSKKGSINQGCHKRFYRHMFFWFQYALPIETSGAASCGTIKLLGEKKVVRSTFPCAAHANSSFRLFSPVFFALTMRRTAIWPHVPHFWGFRAWFEIWPGICCYPFDPFACLTHLGRMGRMSVLFQESYGAVLNSAISNTLKLCSTLQ